MVKMRHILILSVISLLPISCSEGNDITTVEGGADQAFISAVDISSYPEIDAFNPLFYDLEGNQEGFLTQLKENGVNTIRLRLWVGPENEHSGFDEVLQFSESLKPMGFDIWLALHYSDTWADPSRQKTPSQWSNIGFTELKDSVYVYTKKVVERIRPRYIQIGNEINSGFLHPQGHITDNPEQFLQLLETGIAAVRDTSNTAEIILHYAGIDGAAWFFDQIGNLDYDSIGLSYYPIWHGKSMTNLQQTMQQLMETHSKKIVVAETAYPFTLDWNDHTNNIVGLEEQLILPDFPATPLGQQQFVDQLKTIVQEVDNAIGFCYWGGELIAWKGTEATDASSWENQALFDFQLRALPVLQEFVME